MTVDAANVYETTETDEVAERYLEAWAECDPDRIAAMHAEDSVFRLRDGTDPVEGRDAIREAFAGIFATWQEFRFESHRLVVGPRHWTLDWTLIARPAGGSVEVRLGCVDLVELDEDGLVASKDTWLDHADLMALRDAEPS